MNLLMITMLSMGTTLLMDKFFILKVYKTLGDLGYKANIREIDDIADYMCHFSLIGSVIPVYNVFSRMYVYLRLYWTQRQIVQVLKEYDVIRPMTEKELEKYKANPTATTAIKILKDNIIEKSKIQTIYITIDGIENSISYQMVDDRMDIIDIKGPMKEQGKTKEEIEEVILKSWGALFATGIKLESGKFEKTLANSNYLAIKYNDKESGVEEIKYDYDFDELVKLYDYFDSQNIEDENNQKVKTKLK